MSTVDELRTVFEEAESEAIRLSNEYDNARAAVKEKYAPQIKEANERLISVQKQYADAEAAAGLVGREDGQALASALGLEFPEAFPEA